MKNTASDGDMREVASSDEEGWQEREASRTHSVKFTDELPEPDKEVRILLLLTSGYFCLAFRTILAIIFSVLSDLNLKQFYHECFSGDGLLFLETHNMLWMTI